MNPREAPDAPPRLTAKFFGNSGLPELEIVRNEWLCSTGVWDLKISGSTIEVLSTPNQVMLRLKARPPHGIDIQYLNMFFHDIGILIESSGTVWLKIAGTKIRWSSSSVTTADAVFILP